jgi:hypothetical protein
MGTIGWTQDDIVVAGLILLHDAEADSLVAVPEDWSKELGAIAKEFPIPEGIKPRSVGYPCINYNGEKKHRFATMTFLAAHPR